MLRMNEGIKTTILRIIFLVIFSLYTCSITFFTHTHIINGVTIVHSHFYTTDDEGKPIHKHTGAEIQLINNLSTYFSLGLIAFFFLPIIKRRVICIYTPISQSDFRESKYYRLSPLRAPPTAQQLP